MGETLVWFDIPASKTVNIDSKKTVLLKTVGHEKNQFQLP